MAENEGEKEYKHKREGKDGSMSYHDGDAAFEDKSDRQKRAYETWLKNQAKLQKQQAQREKAKEKRGPKAPIENPKLNRFGEIDGRHFNPGAKKKTPFKRSSPAKELRKIKFFYDFMKSGDVVGAYMNTHKKSTKESAKRSVSRFLSAENIEEFKKLLQLDRLATVNRHNLEKILLMVVARWTEGQEKTTDVLKAVDILKGLVPDFVSRHENVTDYSKMSEGELDDEIDKLLGKFKQGDNPSKPKARITGLDVSSN